MGFVDVLPRRTPGTGHRGPQSYVFSLKLSDVSQRLVFTLLCSHVVFLRVANDFTRVVEEIPTTSQAAVGSAAVFQQNAISIPLALAFVFCRSSVVPYFKLSPAAPSAGKILSIAGVSVDDLVERMIVRAVAVSPAIFTFYYLFGKQVERVCSSCVRQTVGMYWAARIYG